LLRNELSKRQFNFSDDRLPELLFRYRARNFPETLTERERMKSHEFCYRLGTDKSGVSRHIRNIYKSGELHLIFLQKLKLIQILLKKFLPLSQGIFQFYLVFLKSVDEIK